MDVPRIFVLNVNVKGEWKMNVRERHARMLIDAADSIAVIKRTSPLPERCLEPALNKAETVWNESANYIDPNIKRPLRIAIVTMRGLLKVTANDEVFIKDDIVSLRRSETAMREVSERILKDRRTSKFKVPQYSATGQRLTNPQEIAGSTTYKVLPADLYTYRNTSANRDPGLPNFHEENEAESAEYLREADTWRSKLPVKLPDTVSENAFVPTRMPLLVIPKHFINEAALNRAHIAREDYAIIKGAHLPRQGDLKIVKDPGILLLKNQYLVGIRGDVVSMNPKEAQQLIDDTIDTISKKYGHRTNPLATQMQQKISSQVITSLGSKLAWIWLVPDIQASVLSVKSVSFPWSTKKSLEEVNHDLKAAAVELKELQELQKFALKKGGNLKVSDLNRISDLMQLLDVNPLQEDYNSLKEELRRLRQKQFTDEGLNSKDQARFDYLIQYLRAASPVKKPETPQEAQIRREKQKDQLEKRVAERFKAQLLEIQTLTDELNALDDVKAKKANTDSTKALKDYRDQIAKLRIDIKSDQQKITQLEGADLGSKLIALQRHLDKLPKELVQELKLETKDFNPLQRAKKNYELDIAIKKLQESPQNKDFSEEKKQRDKVNLAKKLQEQQVFALMERIRLIEKQGDDITKLKDEITAKTELIKKLEKEMADIDASIKIDKQPAGGPVLSQQKKSILARIQTLKSVIDVGRENIRKSILRGEENQFVKKQ